MQARTGATPLPQLLLLLLPPSPPPLGGAVCHGDVAVRFTFPRGTALGSLELGQGEPLFCELALFDLSGGADDKHENAALGRELHSLAEYSLTRGRARISLTRSSSRLSRVAWRDAYSSALASSRASTGTLLAPRAPPPPRLGPSCRSCRAASFREFLLMLG